MRGCRRTYQASSLHQPLLAAVGRGDSGRVLGVYRHAVNLELEAGGVLSLLDPVLGNGPGAVLVPFLSPSGWAPADRVTLDGRGLQGAGAAIRLEGAVLWEPPAPPGRVQRGHGLRLAGAVSVLARAGNPAGLLPAALAALQAPGLSGPGAPGPGLSGPRAPGQAGLAAALLRLGLPGIRRLLAGDWEEGIACLAGLGPGTTPSGDDLLCGFACTLVRAGHPDAAALGAAIRRLPPAATGTLSRHFLGWAAASVAQEQALALVDQLLGGPGPPASLPRGPAADPAPAVPALAPVLRHGATSGADWAAGALLALHYVAEVSPSVAISGREVLQIEAL